MTEDEFRRFMCKLLKILRCKIGAWVKPVVFYVLYFKQGISSHRLGNSVGRSTIVTHLLTEPFLVVYTLHLQVVKRFR